MKKTLFVIFGLLILRAIIFREPTPPPPGLRIDAVPEQSATTQPGWAQDDYEIQPLARYHLKARVLGKKRYYLDPTADLAPYDLALGWAGMSDTLGLNHVSISQSGRWYEYYFDASGPLSGAEIARSSANVHCLPGNDDVWSFLNGVRLHDFVELSGYLVEVRRAGRTPWRSSLVRDDTGNGSCEVFWIEEAKEILP